MFFAAPLDLLSPMCSLEQIAIILCCQFKHYGSRLDAFKQCTVVQQCVWVFRDFHNGKGAIYLGECIVGTKYYLRPCLGNREGCLLFCVLFRIVEKTVGEGLCALCQSKKWRRLEHPSCYTPHGHLTAEDAVKQLKELTIDQIRLRQQLCSTRRLLEKEKDSCFVEEDDECLQRVTV
jgi:hypothetical protein